MSSRWTEVVVDAIDPARLGRWWAEVLGYRLLAEVSEQTGVPLNPPLGTMIELPRAAMTAGQIAEAA